MTQRESYVFAIIMAIYSTMSDLYLSYKEIERPDLSTPGGITSRVI